jgi:hypothetical protein
MDQFVAEQNMAHYIGRLQTDADEVTRSTLHRLLLDEENLLGLTQDQLQRTNRHIEKLRRLIAKQSETIDKRARNGLETSRATTLLSTLNEIMATYQIHRQRIVAALADGRD